jgi:hypothetical protein
VKSWDPAGARDHFGKAYEGAISDTTGSKLMEKIADKSKDGLDDARHIEDHIRKGDVPSDEHPAPISEPVPAPAPAPQGAAPAQTDSSPAVAPAAPAEKKPEAKPVEEPKKTGEAKKPIIEIEEKAQPVTTGKETTPKTR